MTDEELMNITEEEMTNQVMLAINGVCHYVNTNQEAIAGKHGETRIDPLATALSIWFFSGMMTAAKGFGYITQDQVDSAFSRATELLIESLRADGFFQEATVDEDGEVEEIKPVLHS